MPTLTATIDQAYIDAASGMAKAAGFADGNTLICQYLANWLRQQFPAVVPTNATDAKTALDTANTTYNTAITNALKISIT